MQKYRSHKVVEAEKITSIVETTTTVSFYKESLTEIELMFFTCLHGSLDNKPKPKIGMYLVKYEDGYFSFSPAEVFEAGYTKVE